VRGMQKHVEIDEPEETPDLEQTLFGIADPIGSIVDEDEIDGEAVEDELDEDMLTIGEDDEIEIEPGEEPAEEPVADSEIEGEEP
jgi:hypothetical protein